MNLDSWELPSDLLDFIMNELFAQPRLDSSAIVRGRLLYETVRTWLYVGRQYQEISLSDYDKFRKAAKSRGGGYSMELCEFIIEEVLANGNVVLNYWRRIRDDTGKGERIILTPKETKWTVSQHLGLWSSGESDAEQR